MIRGPTVPRSIIMAARKTFKLTDANGSESTKRLTKDIKLGDLLGDNQQGLIDGSVADASTTLRAGDHVEIIMKSGKAGC